MITLQHEDLRVAAFSPCSERVATGGRGGVRVWTLASGDLHCELPLQGDDVVAGLAYADGGKTVVAATAGGVLLAWDATDRQVVRRVALPGSASAVQPYAGGVFVGVCVDYDGSLLHVDARGHVRVLASAKGEGRFTFALSPRGDALAALHIDGHVTETVTLCIVRPPSLDIAWSRAGGCCCHHSGGVAFTSDDMLLVEPDPWTNRISPTRRLIELWRGDEGVIVGGGCGGVVVLDDGRAVGRDGYLHVGEIGAQTMIVPVELAGAPVIFLVRSREGHVACNSDRDELVVFGPRELARSRLVADPERGEDA